MSDLRGGLACLCKLPLMLLILRFRGHGLVSVIQGSCNKKSTEEMFNCLSNWLACDELDVMKLLDGMDYHVATLRFSVLADSTWDG